MPSRSLASPPRPTIYLETLTADLRFALRLLIRNPLSTTIAILSIGLSVGATTVVFTAVKSVLLNPVPFAHPDQLVQLGSVDNHAGPSHEDWLFWHDAHEIAQRTRTLSSVGIYGNAIFDLASDGKTPPEALYGQRISASLFPTLGVSPLIGRNIRPEEDQPHHPNVIILSDGLWKRRFHADPHIVGRTIPINGHNCLVIGVMATGFNFPLKRGATHTPEPYVDFWAPLQADPTDAEQMEGGLQAIGRIRPGMSLAAASEDLTAINTALLHDFPNLNRGRTLRLGLWWDRTLGPTRPALWFLLAAAFLFLLIGCANVANLLLARSLARRHEIALRLAVGAARPRIVRQLLTESCLLALLGGAAGCVFTLAAWRILPAIAPVSIPRLASAHPDPGVLAFALALSLLSGLLFGIAPAFRAARSEDFSTRAGNTQRDPLRSALVTVEAALALTLVLLGSQLLATFTDLLASRPGFDANDVIASVVLPAKERYPTSELRAHVYQRFLESLRALPGVESAGTVDALPFSGENHGGFISANPSDPTHPTVAEVDLVGGDYLSALGIRLTAGRWFRPEETHPANNSAIVSEALARKLWPHADPLGRPICVNCTPQDPHHWTRVVGVVSSIRHAALDDPPQSNSVYLSAGAFEQAAFLVVKTDRPTDAMQNAIRRAIAQVDPNQPVLMSLRLDSLISESVAARRFLTTLLAATAALALLLALAGIYGVTAFTTGRRTREIGIRIALGATPSMLQSLVLRQALSSVLIGLAIGLAFTLAAQRLLHGLIAGLAAQPAGAFWLTATLMLLITSAACWLPARRAARIHPIQALRQD